MPQRSGSVCRQMWRRRETYPEGFPAARLELAKMAEITGETPSAVRSFATMSASLS